jgi:hypothetical protein
VLYSDGLQSLLEVIRVPHFHTFSFKRERCHSIARNVTILSKGEENHEAAGIHHARLVAQQRVVTAMVAMGQTRSYGDVGSSVRFCPKADSTLADKHRLPNNRTCHPAGAARCVAWKSKFLAVNNKT